MDVIKNVPVIEDENVGVSQTLQERKRWDIPRFVLWDLGRNVTKSVPAEGKEKRKSAFRKTCLPLKG